jgi:hypothetical protein
VDRRKITFILVVLLGLVIGFLIKRVTIGLLIGLALGYFAGGLINTRDGK